jgi:ACS family sodium-dependent inorganic phosphate cotransporter
VPWQGQQPCKRRKLSVHAVSKDDIAEAIEVATDKVTDSLTRVSQEITNSGKNGSGPPAESEYPDYKVVVGLCALVSLICSIDRASISVAIVPMSEEFGWSDTVKGTISSAFFVGYTVTNLVGGYVATKYSSKVVLGAGVVLWSLFTIFTPTAANLTVGMGLLPLMLTRAAMGMGEGVAFPSISNLFANWVPNRAKSRSLGLAYSAGQVGNILAMVISPVLITNLGWESAFWVYGTLGLTWMFAWVPLVPDTPPSSKAQLASAGMDPALSDAAQDSGVQKLGDVPWKAFSRSPPAWAVLAVHCSFGVGPLVCLSWLPSYYSSEWGLDVTQSAFLSGLPWACSFALANVSGYAADTLINKGILSTTATRKLMQGIASIGPAACLFLLANDPEGGGSLFRSAALLTGTLAIGGFQAGGYGSNHQDLTTKYSGILFGLTNASASCAGAIAVWLTGMMLDMTDSWSMVFGAVGCVYLIGYLVFAIWGSGDKQHFDDW